MNTKSDKPSIIVIKMECDKHGQQLNLYCPCHLMPCCDECISTSHSKCTGITSLAGIVEKTKIEKSKETVETDINSILSFLEELVNNKSKNIKSGENQYKDIQKSIKEMRQEINKLLDHLEKNLSQKLDTIWEQEKSKATNCISEIEGKKKNLKEIKKHLQTVTTNTSKLQSFLGVHQIEQQVQQYQGYVEDLENYGITKEFEIKMKQNDETENILSKLESLKPLGVVTIFKTEIDFHRQTSVRREAQVESQEQPNINNMTMDIETKIEISIKKRISDIICLMDGRVIIVEEEDNVQLLTSDGKLQKQLPILGYAFNVSQINQDTIAITYPGEQAIKIFNMENETVTKVITLDKDCWGLSCSNNSLAVGLYPREIRIIDLEGSTLKSIQLEYESALRYLVYCNDRVIYSDESCCTVYCVDGSGRQIWEYPEILIRPQGLCKDYYGNIIVADLGSSRIIVMSKDGQESKILLERNDELVQHPQCICFKHNESSGFICNLKGTYLTKFNSSYG